MFPWDRFGNSFVLKGLKALLEARPGSWLLFRVRFGISFFFGSARLDSLRRTRPDRNAP